MGDAMSTTAIGRMGEDLALNYLRNKGYVYVDRNFKRTHGEIDLIMKDGSIVVFVEVKTRKSRAYGDPIESVTLFKQRHIRYCANIFLTLHKWQEENIRFDVVEILIGPGERVKYRHVKNAF